MLALPEAVAPAKTALIVVDVQNDFGHPDGTFGRRGNDRSGHHQMVAERLLPVIAAARHAGVAIVLTRMDHDWLDHQPGSL